MALSELNNLPQLAADWPAFDASLLGDCRHSPAAAFPVHLLPDHWRAWIEASSRLFGSPDYLAHCLLGGVAGVGGAGIRIEVTTHWREPLLLWQALVGGPSSGRTASFARVRALLAEVVPDLESGERAAPAVLTDAGLDRASGALSESGRGVLLWREDLADWMAEAGARTGASAGSSSSARRAWLSGWNAGSAVLGAFSTKDCFAVGVLGALAPGSVGGAVGNDSALASRFLYAWPGRAASVSLAEVEADDAGLVSMLQKIAGLAGHRETPTVLPFDAGAARRLESLLPAIRQRADAAEEDGRGAGDLAVEWIGRGATMIVRLAGVLSLMEWAETSEATSAEYLPVGAAHVEAAHALWADYYLPHALAVFDRAGVTQGEQAARRVVRWLRRVRAPQVSREEVRREALCQSVSADFAEEVLARLERAGVVREMVVTEATRRGPRRRRWEVHPGISANSASALVS